jgi:hypothetical protein
MRKRRHPAADLRRELGALARLHAAGTGVGDGLLDLARLDHGDADGNALRRPPGELQDGIGSYGEKCEEGVAAHQTTSSLKGRTAWMAR